jgi:hypothetical protein
VGRSKQWNLEPLGLANRAGEERGDPCHSVSSDGGADRRCGLLPCLVIALPADALADLQHLTGKLRLAVFHLTTRNKHQ